MPTFRAAIFDWDGVIIDSHDQHEQSWFLLAEELDQPFTTAQFKETFGQRNQTILPMLGWTDPDDTTRIAELGDRKEELYRELIRKDGIDALPGVTDLLSALAHAGILCGVGSSTPRANIDCIAEIIGVQEHFKTVVAAADVSRGKPDPEVFMTCADRLDMPPEDCVVFEDAHAGIQAAIGGGMKAVALTTTHPAGSFENSGADHIVKDLSEISLEHLSLLFFG